MARVRDAVEAWRDDLVELTRELVRIPSENPPGRARTQAQEWIVAQLDRHEIGYQVLDSSLDRGEQRVIAGTIGDSGPLVYLHGHYDVVPAHDPAQFDARVADGAVVGRGACDMKGGLVSALAAAVVHRGLGGAGRVRLVYVPDEETGGAEGAERLAELGVLEQRGERDGAIVAEPSWPGLWNAARGAFTVRVTVRGRPAHVGLHYEGVSAVELGHRVLGELYAYRDEIARRRTGLRIEPDAARESIMLIGGVVSGGTNFNIVPDELSFTVDRRPNADEDYEAARGELLELLRRLGEAAELEVEVLQDVAPSLTSPDDSLVTTVERAIRDVAGRDVSATMCPGCLETRVYARAGIPAVAYGPGPMAVMHGPDEHVPIENLVEASAVYATVLGERLGYGE